MAKINNIKAMFLLLLICLLFVIGMIRMRHIINAKRSAAASAAPADETGAAGEKNNPPDPVSAKRNACEKNAGDK
ncbi:MAG TPA: hypothetical protein PK467_18000 [Candidatus Wallbacteria bacterium]|nr:hypothetical protein [Candidatus Wallbacteria bacterium]